MNIEKILNFAYFYLKFRPRTRQEMLRYLQRKSQRYHFTEEEIQETITGLEKEGQLDDRKFIEMYVHDRTLFKPRSEYLLRRELQKLGIAKDLMDEYFSLHTIDESSLAYDALLRKKRIIDTQKEDERFKKAVSFLMRKGFSYDISKKAFHKLYQTDANQ